MAKTQHTEQPIHLATKTIARARCYVTPAPSDTRLTGYPALVTCLTCRSLFTPDERKMTDPNSEPLDV